MALNNGHANTSNNQNLQQQQQKKTAPLINVNLCFQMYPNPSVMPVPPPQQQPFMYVLQNNG